MQDAHSSDGERCGSLSSLISQSSCFAQYEPHPLVIDIVVDGSCGIRASAHTSHEVVRIVASFLLFELPLDFLADDRLQASHHVGIRMWTYCRTYYIECVGRMTAPVADRLVGRILEGLVSTVHRIDLSSQHAHALYVRTLALYIQCAHIHAARHIHQSAHRSCSHTMLTCTRLCHDTSLAHLLGNQYLSDGIVDLMCASVIEVLALQIELAAIFLAHALGEIQR